MKDKKGIRHPTTPKAKRFFQNLISSRTQTEAAIKAGYAEKSARVSATKNMQKYNNHWNGLLDKAGCTEKHLASTISEGTQAVKVIGYLQSANKEKDGKPKKVAPDESISNEFVDTPDWQARAKFAELALKLRDAFPESKLKLSGSIDIPPDTGTLDQVIAKMKPNEKAKFVGMLAECFGA